MVCHLAGTRNRGTACEKGKEKEYQEQKTAQSQLLTLLLPDDTSVSPFVFKLLLMIPVSDPAHGFLLRNFVLEHLFVSYHTNGGSARGNRTKFREQSFAFSGAAW